MDPNTLLPGTKVKLGATARITIGWNRDYKNLFDMDKVYFIKRQVVNGKYLLTDGSEELDKNTSCQFAKRDLIVIE